MTTNTSNKNSIESDHNVSDSEVKIKEQISSIINEKFIESLEQVQNDPERLRKKSFYSGLWRSTKLAIKAQLESIGRGFYAAMIAIIVAILTPIMLNSTLLEKLEVMNRRIENALPSEQDKEIQHKIMEAISVQTALKERPEEVINSQVLVKSELEKQLAESPLVVQSNLDARFVGLESSITALQEEILNLRRQEEQLNQKIAELSLSGFNIAVFLKHLAVLKQRGKRFEDKLSNGQYSENALNDWLKTVYFLTGSLSFVKRNSFDGAVLLMESMRDIVESKGDFHEPQKQISETFVILDSIEFLVKSGLIDNRRDGGGN